MLVEVSASAETRCGGGKIERRVAAQPSSGLNGA